MLVCVSGVWTSDQMDLIRFAIGVRFPKALHALTTLWVSNQEDDSVDFNKLRNIGEDIVDDKTFLEYFLNIDDATSLLANVPDNVVFNETETKLCGICLISPFMDISENSQVADELPEFDASMWPSLYQSDDEMVPVTVCAVPVGGGVQVVTQPMDTNTSAVDTSDASTNNNAPANPVVTQDTMNVDSTANPVPAISPGEGGVVQQNDTESTTGNAMSDDDEQDDQPQPVPRRKGTGGGKVISLLDSDDEGAAGGGASDDEDDDDVISASNDEENDDVISASDDEDVISASNDNDEGAAGGGAADDGDDALDDDDNIGDGAAGGGAARTQGSLGTSIHNDATKRFLEEHKDGYTATGLANYICKNLWKRRDAWQVQAANLAQWLQHTPLPDRFIEVVDGKIVRKWKEYIKFLNGDGDGQFEPSDLMVRQFLISTRGSHLSRDPEHQKREEFLKKFQDVFDIRTSIEFGDKFSM